MTQVGDGPASVTAAGDLLAERYRLERHINDDSAGRQVWRGVDVVLRRPVAVVMRAPGGDAAEEMLSAAVTASRVSHSNLIGVYDAIDEGFRAFVVREWIEGSALRDMVTEEEPLDPDRTTSVLHAVASALSALHASGMAHGNIHPGTILVGNDGRIVLTDARVDASTSPESDVRALGACGYFMLTGHWPWEGGRAPSALPDGRRDAAGTLAAPRQVRAGVPSYLDDLIMDLLNLELSLPTAAVLSAELARLDLGEQGFFGSGGTLGFADEGTTAEPSRTPTPRLVAIGGTALALVITGLVLGVKALNAKADPQNPPASISATPSIKGQTETLKLTPAQIRIVDPKGDRQETKNAENVIDGDIKTTWKTNGYTKANFGGSKDGMGILISLDKPVSVASVKLQLALGGAAVELRTGHVSGEASSAGDTAIVTSYERLGNVQTSTGTTVVFPAGIETQYLLIWFTELPLADQASEHPYRISVQEISVEVQ